MELMLSVTSQYILFRNMPGTSVKNQNESQTDVHLFKVLNLSETQERIGFIIQKVKGSNCQTEWFE